MRTSLNNLRESIRALLTEAPDVDAWCVFECDLMVPDDVYAKIQEMIAPARQRAEKNMTKPALEYLQSAGLLDVNVDWNARPFPKVTGSSWKKAPVEAAFDSAFEQPWIEQATFMHVDSKFAGDKVRWDFEMMVRPMEDAGYRSAYESFVNDWFAPFRKELDESGAMDIEFLPVGPAGGNPFVKCRTPSVLSENIANILAKIAMEPPIIVCGSRKKGRK